MSKLSPRKDTTLKEMEELMSQSDADEGQFAAYLQRKLAEKQPPLKNDLLFGSVSFDFDFDVNLIKKPTPTVTSGDNPDVVVSGETNETPPNFPTAEKNQPTPLPAATNSPNSSPNRIRSKNVPGSDKLRRRAIRRLSQSCGRQLIKEFEVISSSPGTFKPVVFSTPCASQPPKDIHVKEIEETPQMIKAKTPEAEQPAEKSQVQTEPKKGVTTLESRPVDTAAEASLMYRERLSSFQNNILQLDYTGHAPSSDRVGCTYTIEKGPAPGQLLLSPSRRSPSCTAPQKRFLPIVKVKRHREEVLIPDTPPRTHTRGSEKEPEYVVPDTQFQELGELVQNLSRNASGPIVVINTANSKPTAELVHAQPESVVPTVSSALTPLHLASTEVASTSLQLVAANYNSSPAAVAASQAKPLESPKSSRKSLLVINNVDAVMTDDESDEQPSTVAMNLAQRGGGSNHRSPTPDPDKENFVQLLNLHQSNNAKKSKQKTKSATVPLNKAPCAPINGEQFAQELARMSNYEILDLRKRNSLGKVYPVNGQKKSSKVQQLDLERSIQLELMRRNLKISGDRWAGSTTADELPVSEDMLPSPVTNTNRNMKQGSQSKDRSPRKFDESDDNAVLPPPPPLNFKDTKKQRETQRSSTRQQMESSDDGEALPPQVPCNFEDSRRRPQRSKGSSRCYSRVLSDESSDENEEPPVPCNFQDSRKRSNRQSQRKLEKSKDDTSSIPPPAPNAFRDRRSYRSRFRSSQESKELSNYLMISKTMEMRRMSRRSTKRKLYTKGDSNAECSDLESPKKQKRYSHSYSQSEVNNQDDTIAIVPPPPNSLRYSQSLRDLRQMDHIDFENAPLEDLYANKENAIIEIAPPPPENIGLILLREESNENAILSPQTESDCTTEQALPPPTEYNEPESDEIETLQNDAPVKEGRLASSKEIIAKASKISEDPERQCVSSSKDKSTLRLDIVVDNEQPSTSRAAHKAREGRTQKDKTESQVEDETIFKKPLKPAPRVKSKELDKLMHSVIYRPTSLDDGSTCSQGLRRSKRGQVPIKNTWCHTQDIMQMPFMCAKSMEKPKNKSGTLGKKKPTSATKKIINPLSDRGPVCSSTPRNPDIVVEPFPDSAFLGQHSAISSKEPSAETDAESHHNFDPGTSKGQTTSNNGKNQFRNWLLGVSNVQPSETNDRGRAASFAEDLRFSDLDGIDYAFYTTKETAALGYMRFKPHQVRNKRKIKGYPLKFIVQIGEFAVQYGAIDEEEEESCILHEGDMVEIDKGNRYSIQNILDTIGVLLVIRN